VKLNSITKNRQYYNNNTPFTMDYCDNHAELYCINCINKNKTHHNQQSSIWLLDSGSSINISKNLNTLKNIKTCHMSITLPNGKLLTSKRCGTFIGYINNINTNHNIDLWHRRFCHFNIKNIISKLNKVKLFNKCNICKNSMLKNSPYPTNINKSKRPLQLIHIDFVGPISESIYDTKYFLSILDDFSRYGWTIFMKNKSEFFELFINWINKIENISDLKIKFIRSDNGLEFKSKEFNNFCNKRGITQQFTVPYNPQQNGKCERFNGTLIKHATAMLQDAKLSKKFWHDAVSTANYVYNRIPHHGNDQKIPFEIFFDQAVNYSNLKVFGCKVFYYIPKNLRSKLDNSAASGIFIGYADNPTAYKIYDTTRNKVVLARTVEFMEDEPANFRMNNPLIHCNQTNDYGDIKNNINNINLKRKSSNTYNNFYNNKRNKLECNYNLLIEPLTFNDIYNCIDKKEWLQAVKDELDMMKKLNVYESVDEAPEGSNIISSKWVFKYKRNDSGEIIK